MLGDAGGPGLDESVIKILEEVAGVLSKYRSGPLPKIVKIMPKFRNWITLLYHTSRFSMNLPSHIVFYKITTSYETLTFRYELAS